GTICGSTMALDLVKEHFKIFLGNRYFMDKEPWQIVSITTTVVLSGVWLWGFVFQEERVKSPKPLSQPYESAYPLLHSYLGVRCSSEVSTAAGGPAAAEEVLFVFWSVISSTGGVSSPSLVTRGKRMMFRIVRQIPAVAHKIDSEMKKINKSFEEEVIHRNQGNEYIVSLPDQGKRHEEIVDMVKRYLTLGDYHWQSGFVSGAVYYYDQNLIKLLTDVYGLASYTNPLHPDIFPGVCKMEAEVVRMTANLFHGGPASCGTMTTGGTESILMACKAYRDYASEEWGIKQPEIVLPKTAHTAFDKAGLYFKIHLKHVPVDSTTYAVDIKAMQRAITRNTILLVGSAPNFPYGTMDDIEAIAALGLRKGIPVHVDACLGGFIIAFMRQAGFSLPPFDFAVPGVTSISADTHKASLLCQNVLYLLEFKSHLVFFCEKPEGKIIGIHMRPQVKPPLQ
ncbi:hypothetical protein PR048_030444, partial [Dryococelus australis]